MKLRLLAKVALDVPQIVPVGLLLLPEALEKDFRELLAGTQVVAAKAKVLFHHAVDDAVLLAAVLRKRGSVVGERLGHDCVRTVGAEVARLSLHREQLLHVAHEPVACGLLLVDLLDERIGLGRLEHREPVADALVRLDRVEERVGSDTGVDAFEERDLLGVLDRAGVDRREGVHDGVPVHAGGRVPDKLGLDVVHHLLRLAAFDPQIARAATGLPRTVGVLRNERLYAGDALRLRRLRAHDPAGAEEHFVVEKLRMLVAEPLPVVHLTAGEEILPPHLARARHHLADVYPVRFVAADGLHEEVVVGRGLLVRLGRLEIEA